MRKIGIGQTFYCNPYGFEQGLARMSAHGYEGIDYQEFVETETPLFQKTPQEFEQYLERQAKAIAQAGLVIHQTHGPWRCPPRDVSVEEREERFEKMSRSILGTAILGSKHMVLHPIMPYSVHDAEHVTDTFDSNIEFFGRLSEVGREHGVTICLENLPFRQFSLSHPEEVLKLVKTLNHSYVKICIDTGHCAAVGASPAEAVRITGKDYLRAMHVHDNDGSGDLHWYPYEGIIDWESFGKSLKEIEYSGVFSLEVKRTHPPTEENGEQEECNLFENARKIASYTE